MSSVAEKVCARCGVLKPIGEFGKNQDKIRSRCKPCRSREVVEWARNNPEIHNARLRRWRATRPEVARAIVKRYAKRNMATKVARVRAWRAANPERWKAIQKAWNTANADRRRRDGARRRAAELRAVPPWADPEAIRLVYLAAIAATRETGEPHEVDHIYPLVSPVVCGLHCETNLRVVPRAVNRSKGNRLDVAQAA